MHARIRAVAAAAAFAVLLSSAPARATRFDLGLGASYWFNDKAVFDLNFALRAPVARQLSVGGRIGALLITTGPDLGVPADLLLRVTIGRAYLEGAVGPWILFGSYRHIRAHAGFGFGLQAGAVSVGLEVGYLHPSPLLSLRVAFAL